MLKSKIIMNILMVLSAPNVSLGGNVTHPLRECFHTAVDDISCSVRGKQTEFGEPTATLAIILNWRQASQMWFNIMRVFLQNYPDSKVHRANNQNIPYASHNMRETKLVEWIPPPTRSFHVDIRFHYLQACGLLYMADLRLWRNNRCHQINISWLFSKCK